MPTRDKEKQKTYQRNWYERNRHIVLECKQRKRRKMREWYNQQKSAPCVDCHISYPPYVMDYDHLASK